MTNEQHVGRALTAFIRAEDQIPVNVLALTALVVTLGIRVIFSNAQPWFWHGAELAGVCADLAIAYLAAWFFYFLVSWWPAYEARQKAAKVVASRTWVVLSNADAIKATLRGAASSPTTGRLSRTELTDLCGKVNLRDVATGTFVILTGQPVSVLQRFHRSVLDTRGAVGPILQMGSVFDSDVVIAAASLAQADFGALIDSLTSIEPTVSPQLTVAPFEGQLWSYLTDCETLWVRLCERYPAAASTVVDVSNVKPPHRILEL